MPVKHEVTWLEHQAVWARPLGIVVGALLAGLALLAHLDRALLEHLDATFATRADLQHTETKIIDRLDALEHRLDLYEP